jgi:transmembrane sensor
MKKTLEHIDETILLKIIENTADANEKNLFNVWIESSEMHAKEFEQLKKVYQFTSISTLNKQKNWESVVQKAKAGMAVPNYIELPDKQVSSMKIPMKTLLRYAAIFLIILGVSFFVKLIVFDSEQLTISGTNLKTHAPYKLADSSLVYLNGNAEISFSKNFGKKKREISLKGEAFFEVHRNEKIPFIISTYNTTTQVLGTSFNVYSDASGKVKVSVVSGVVAFYSESKENGVKLTAGEQAAYKPGEAIIEKEQYADPNFLSWKTGILYFNETPITAAFSLLQKQYSRVFVFESKKTKLPTLTTTLENQSLEAVLEELNLLLNTKNVTRNDTIFFKSNN